MTLPKKKRQVSNGSQISQHLQLTTIDQNSGGGNKTTATAAATTTTTGSAPQVTITTTTTITTQQKSGGEIGQRRKWVVQDAPQKLETAIQETQIPNQGLQNQSNLTGSIIGNLSMTSNETTSKTIQ